MKCINCGKEIADDEMFCPFCQMPQDVTDEYDNIRNEIGANVDKIKTSGREDEVSAASEASDDLSKTRKVFGNDSVFDEEDKVRREKAISERKRAQAKKRNLRVEYDDEYEYEDDEMDDSGQTLREYEDWGIEKKKSKNKGTVITTIIIALICILGIAAIIYFGLMPNAAGGVEDVISVYNQENKEINEGDEFSEEVSISLVSKEGYDIRYTTDGSEVDENSTLYIGPVLADAEGAFQIKALSFDERGRASGEGLSRTIRIIKQTQTTTSQETEPTRPVITQDEAETILKDTLVEEGAINEDFSTDYGGTMNLSFEEDSVIDGLAYYIFKAEFYDSENVIWETSYYGVDTQAGTCSYLNKTDNNGYVIVE